ncbi:hypothetical protein QJQ45_025283 [Haematococcus lacustris]|nr:hypothetical protein QJQ45_025283 [Haematococcus lacustris]
MPPSEATRKAAEALKAEGNALFAKERYGAAIDRFTEAICLCPDMAALYVNRALCHKKLGDSAHALEDAEKAVQRDTAYMKAHYLLGWAARDQGQWALAVRHLQKAAGPVWNAGTALASCVGGKVQQDLGHARSSNGLASCTGGRARVAVCWVQSHQACATPPHPQPLPLQALETARAHNDSIKDEVWRELAKAQYAQWQADSSQRQEQRKQLRARVSAWGQRDAGGTPGTSTTSQQSPAAATQPELPQQWWDDLFRDASRLDTPCEVPGAYTCPLTMEVFREPVITPAGHCYEQASILEHLSKVGPWDPLRRDVKVTPDMLVPNLALRTAVQLYLEEHPYAWGECR